MYRIIIRWHINRQNNKGCVININCNAAYTLTGSFNMRIYIPVYIRGIFNKFWDWGNNLFIYSRNTLNNQSPSNYSPVDTIHFINSVFSFLEAVQPVISARPWYVLRGYHALVSAQKTLTFDTRSQVTWKWGCVVIGMLCFHKYVLTGSVVCVGALSWCNIMTFSSNIVTTVREANLIILVH